MMSLIEYFWTNLGTNIILTILVVGIIDGVRWIIIVGGVISLGNIVEAVLVTLDRVLDDDTIVNICVKVANNVVILFGC